MVLCLLVTLAIHYRAAFVEQPNDSLRHCALYSGTLCFKQDAVQNSDTQVNKVLLLLLFCLWPFSDLCRNSNKVIDSVQTWTDDLTVTYRFGKTHSEAKRWESVPS